MCLIRNMIYRIYRYLNIFSLDVALGAIICACAIADPLQFDIPADALISLGLCVWLIYTADHLMDAQRIKCKASTLRHYLHQVFFKKILLVFCSISALGLVSLFFLPASVIRNGSLLFLLVLVYFLIMKYLKRWFIPKELLIALIYAAGIFLIPFSLYKPEFDYFMLFLFIQFLLLALVNLLLLAYIEYSSDQKDGHVSFPLFIGLKKTNIILWCLLLLEYGLILFFIVFSVNADFIALQWVLMAMTFILNLIFIFPSLFRPHDRYRILGDAVFLFPVVLLV